MRTLRIFFIIIMALASIVLAIYELPKYAIISAIWGCTMMLMDFMYVLFGKKNTNKNINHIPPLR